ncbi:Protein NYNRIN [Ceratobasidium theobromae]|uniref:Protein NYNRIN n=1 Tax=Ceratobasidium theobromae TaxID=1582974 RepID=A0A5N5Q7K9_9AGAM|nr:Protein NYNRIN [Ceratobasidium theobromae]
MSWPTSILQAMHWSATPIPFDLRTRRFYSLGGQASHIYQTDCQFLEQVRLSAERIKRSFSLNLGLAADNSHNPKQVRFKEGDVNLEVQATTYDPELAEIANDAPHLESSAGVEPPIEHAQSPEDSSCLPANDSTTGPARLHVSPSEDLVTEDSGHTYIEHYPDPSAGSPINSFIAPPFDLRAYIKSAGSLSNLEHFNTLELLMTYQGRTPWRNCAQMLKDLDALPHGPKWVMYKVEMKMKNGEMRVEYLFGWNIIDLVRGIIGDQTLKHDLRYAPVRVWTTRGRKERVYREAWTGEWWWQLQYALRLKDKFATIVPLIISTDKTHLSVMCGGQVAYPVYISIGNVPKSIRHKVGKQATVLLGYLPVDDFADVTNPNERARLKHQLTHNAMSILMEPLKQATEEGVVMTCANGLQRRIYPIPAAFEGDWPEQCCMACVDEGSCPICEQVFGRRSDYPNLAPNQERKHTLAALYKYWQNDKDPGELVGLRLKPWWLWWASIPNYNFHASIMPDLLHQLYQGMIKTHAVAWVKKVVGVGLVDQRFRAMPGTAGLRHFAKGISRVTQWTGHESKEMSKQLLLVVVGQRPNFIALIRSILDFTFRTHQSQMTEGELERLTRALGEFHAKKESLVAEGIYGLLDGLNNVKKLHMLTHYAFAIHELGMPDGYNTESPEHLHIIYTKRGWCASNKVRPLPQMAKFIQRYEALQIHRMYIDMYYDCRSQNRVESQVVYGKDEDAISGVEGPEEQAELEERDDGGGGEESDGEDEGEQRRIQPTTPAGQHVYLDPDWSMAISPTVPHVTGLDIINT